MRIKEKTHTATCLKMTDEMNGDTRRELTANKETEHKLNCNISLSSEDYEFNSGSKLYCNKGLKCHSQKEFEKEDVLSPDSPNLCSEDNTSGGGRLKFFKDGKFILELSHRKDGEKACWIPVPKKTYWPLVSSVRQENSTTLSVSDDSSSVQSSPWQRDHCWKQPNPRPNLGQDLEFYFVRNNRQPVYSYEALKLKRRRPFDLDTVMEPLLGKTKCKIMQKESLTSIIRLLWERVVNSCKLEPGIVSPRKRILRELERVTLEEASKRQKAKATVRNISSHSISSILGKEDDSVLRNLLRSPSPENVRSVVPAFPPHQIQAVYPPSTTSYYPQVAQSFRSQLHPTPSLWPLNYSSSSPSPTLPLYPLQTYSSNWAHSQQSVSPETATDVPLNLSKNAG
ncbi:uncharacterized protein H [Halyomorpha halys]|uniref:uncharacterized protein H n=1 Tax=Halyomorpha halys TaxID=286706 RepID=UPI0006D5069C|nr:uncharacterized protein LOC106689837 [Halyomorpha halys]XP_014290511.1 uncharacterized protein LOC106689837 [Halyomorpha halys]